MEPDALDPGTCALRRRTRARCHCHGQCPGSGRSACSRTVRCRQRVHRRLTRCRAALATGPASFSRRQLVDEYRPMIDEGHLVFASSRKISTHGCGCPSHGQPQPLSATVPPRRLPGRQHIDGPRERRPERHGDDATAPASETSTTRAWVTAQFTGSARAEAWEPRSPVQSGCPRGAEVDPDAVGTSSRGATAQSAVKARTVTPSLVRVN